MSKNVTITLERPIIGHGPDITRVVYRPPRMREIMQAGHPYTIHRTPDRVPFLVDDNEAIAFYAEACLHEPADYALIEGQATVSDVLKIREAIKDFFLLAGAATGESRTSPQTSSSSSDGSPTPSAT